MPDILQQLPIRAKPEIIYAGVSVPAGLDAWWTQSSRGAPALGNEYELDFGPEFQWKATVTKCVPPVEFELRIHDADPDWNGTLVGFRLTPTKTGTDVHFHHRGWPAENDHYRTSVHCWALYLRLLRRHIEHQEFVPYGKRLDA